MSEMLNILGSLSVSASLLAAMLFMVKPLFRKIVSKTWQYYIWLIIVARLLIPFTPLFNLVDLFPVYSVSDQYILPDSTAFFRFQEEPLLQEPPARPGNENIQADTVQKDLYLQSEKYLFITWVSVGSLLFLKKIGEYQFFIHRLKKGAYSITSEKVENSYIQAVNKINIIKPPVLKMHPYIHTPMLVGLWKPVILLPEALENTDGLQYIFLHELIHHKRLDFLYKWAVQLTVCIHWFNPLVYLIRKEIARSCELSCDESVMIQLQDTETKQYGDTLVASLLQTNQFDSVERNSLALTEGAKMMEERLKAIKMFKKKSKNMVVLIAVFTILMAGSAFFVGVSFAASRDTSPIEQLTQPLKAYQKIRPLKENSQENQLMPAQRTENPLVTYDSVQVMYYSGGYPYAHEVITNNTNQAIEINAFGMLAYDENGEPLKLQWNYFDSSLQPDYAFVCTWDDTLIQDGETYDLPGGWSLFGGNPYEPEVPGISYEVAYVLYNFKTLTLSDGTVWENPDFDQWLTTYKGKAVAVSDLQNYYPYAVEVLQ